MRIALLFGRADVDAFLDEIDAVLFDEWCQFLAVEPQGWQADELVARRLGFLMCQVRSRKRLDERKFGIRLGRDRGNDPKAESRRFEAFAIRSRIRARREAERAANPRN